MAKLRNRGWLERQYPDIPMPQPTGTRIGTSDRFHSQELLLSAHEQGYLTADELTSRLNQSENAQFDSQLTALHTDLPTRFHWSSQAEQKLVQIEQGDLFDEKINATVCVVVLILILAAVGTVVFTGVLHRHHESTTPSPVRYQSAALYQECLNKNIGDYIRAHTAKDLYDNHDDYLDFTSRVESACRARYASN